MKRFLKDNGLSLVFFCLFVIALLGQTLTGWHEYNSDQQEHRQPEATLGEYLRGPHFLEATMENWESEFLQMFAYVILTAFLYQKGSAESKRPGTVEMVDQDPRTITRTELQVAPWPVKKGGFLLLLYENSLGLVFLILFLTSLWLHAVGGAQLYSQEELLHGGAAVTTWGYMHTSRFWFESFQNWQSEFLSVLCMVVFSIFLRQRWSPESKPVHAPHSETTD